MDSIKSIVEPDAENENFWSGNLFIQLEYCGGKSLENIIKEREKPDRKQNYDIICQLVDGVASIHGMGIVHQDLKPVNIFF
jgi:serine/threonine protein kinase